MNMGNIREHEGRISSVYQFTLLKADKKFKAALLLLLYRVLA